MSSSKKSSRKQAHGETRSSSRSRSRSGRGAGRREGAGSRGKAARSRRGGLALPFSGSRLLLLGLAVLVIGAGAYLLLNRERPRPWADGDGPKKPWNVLLVSLDTTRPDRLEACGGGPVPTPGLDRVLGDGFLFTEMITPVPNTLPAHASLFTGDNPYRHGVRENIEHALAVPTPTLAAAYRDAGYTTAAVVAAFVMSERFGLAQGFEFYEDRLWGPEPGLGPGTVELPGEIIVSRTSRYLADYHARRQRGEEDRPFFLFVHFFDAHTPYRPPMPHAAQYPDQPYHGELAYQDLCLGRVLDALETYGLAENTLIWVVSDHGESLWEHGEPTHAVFIYDCAVKVVSVLRPPAENGRYEASAPRLRIGAQTSLIDVAPTLLELTRTPAWSLAASSLPAEGASLVPLMRAEEVAERPAYCETLSPMISYHWAPLYGVRTADWKYIRAPNDAIFFLSSDNWWTSYNYSADMATAAAYVDGGGCLFAIGQDMLYGGGASAYDFVTSYCGVVDVIEDVVFPGYMMDWEGTVGGPLEGVSEPGYVPCFGSNDWYTDEVFPASQGVVTYTMTDPPYGPAEGGSLADALFSTVEFGCTNFPDSVIPALMEFCGGATPAEDASWGSIKGQFK